MSAHASTQTQSRHPADGAQNKYPVEPVEIALECAAARTVVYRVISSSLVRPSQVALGAMNESDTYSALRQAVEILNQFKSDASSTLTHAVERWIVTVGTAELSTLTTEFQRLFGHSLRGRIVPYETEYGPDSAFRQSDELADISGFYHAFGLTLVDRPEERIDHLAIESEFLSFLTRKEAVAFGTDDTETAAIVRDAQKKFFRDHFGCFARSVGEALITNAGAGFFKSVGEVLTAFLRCEEAGLAVTLGAGFVPLRTDTEDEVPMACGSCELKSMDDES